MKPIGPKKITDNRQIALPKELMDAARLQPGDEVYVMAADDPVGAMLVVSVTMAERWLDNGRRTERKPVTAVENRKPSGR